MTLPPSSPLPSRSLSHRSPASPHPSRHADVEQHLHPLGVRAVSNPQLRSSSVGIAGFRDPSSGQVRIQVCALVGCSSFSQPLRLARSSAVRYAQSSVVTKCVCFRPKTGNHLGAGLRARNFENPFTDVVTHGARDAANEEIEATLDHLINMTQTLSTESDMSAVRIDNHQRMPCQVKVFSLFS